MESPIRRVAFVFLGVDSLGRKSWRTILTCGHEQADTTTAPRVGEPTLQERRRARRLRCLACKPSRESYAREAAPSPPPDFWPVLAWPRKAGRRGSRPCPKRTRRGSRGRS